MHETIQAKPTPSFTSLPTLTITRPTNGDTANRLMKRVLNRHGTAMRTRPVICKIGPEQAPIWANAGALPFADGSIGMINLINVLEHVRDDEQLIAEASRVLAPGATLRLRVPNAGPLSGFDSLNLYHYLVDITHRGERPHEVDEIGWRRHYGLNDLMMLLGPDRFVIAHAETNGIGASELAKLAAMGMFRWLTSDEERYRRALRLSTAADRLAPPIPTASLGFWIDIMAIRLPPTPPSFRGEPSPF